MIYDTVSLAHCPGNHSTPHTFALFSHCPLSLDSQEHTSCIIDPYSICLSFSSIHVVLHLSTNITLSNSIYIMYPLHRRVPDIGIIQSYHCTISRASVWRINAGHSVLSGSMTTLSPTSLLLERSQQPYSCPTPPPPRT